MRDEIERYRERNVRPFGINPATAQQHAEYVERLGLPIVLLSDPGLGIAREYRATLPWKVGITRTVYLVGQDGTIRFSARGAPGADISLEALD